jgi:hypothetical protein
VARAIVAVVRKQAKATRGKQRNVEYVHLAGSNTDEVILASEWALILPYIEDGTFSPIRYPVAPGFGYLDPLVHFDGSTLDRKDWFFYQRVLGVLQQLFPESYPTSNT